MANIQNQSTSNTITDTNINHAITTIHDNTEPSLTFAQDTNQEIRINTIINSNHANLNDSNTLLHPATASQSNSRKYLLEDYFHQVEPRPSITRTIDTTAPQQVQPPSRTRTYVQPTLPTHHKGNHLWGSSIQVKDPKTFRLFFQNVNSLQYSDNDGGKWSQCLTNMKERQCDIIGFAETCTDWKLNNIRHRFKQTANRILKNTHISYSSNSYPSINNGKRTSYYQPGGTIQTVTGHWVGRVIREILDKRKMGRWCGHHMRLTTSSTITIITAYRPCINSDKSKLSTSRSTSAQQYIMLKQQAHPTCDPRTTFIDDMIELIKFEESIENNFVILMLDANEHRHDKSSQLRRLQQETTLLDAFTTRTNKDCDIATHITGKRRIDYLFISTNLQSHIGNVGILKFFEENNESDHRGMFIDLPETLIDNKVFLKRPEKRLISSKSSQNEIFAYKQALHQQLEQHNIYERAKNILEEATLQGLENSADTIQQFSNKLNLLDQEITNAMLHTESLFCKNQFESAWSIELHHASIECKYWRKILKGIKHHIDVSVDAHELLLKLPEARRDQINHNLIHSKASTESNRAHRHKKELMKKSSDLRQESLDTLRDVREQEGKLEVAKIIKRISNAEIRRQDWLVLNSTYKPDT